MAKQINDNFNLDWNFSFERKDAFPIDRSSIFTSLADAKKYAAGEEDSRFLSGTSYVGQIISVVENNTVNVYKIVDTDGNLELIGTQADWEATEGVAAILNKPPIEQGSGDYSLVIGTGGIAEGEGAVAWGQTYNYPTKATEDYSFAFGRGPQATGLHSLAIGLRTNATGIYSVAIGSWSNSKKGYACAFGESSIADGSYSLAFGSGPQTYGSYALAFGDHSIVNGTYSLAFGNYSEAQAMGSFAFGTQASIASGDSEVGASTQAIGVNSFAFGRGSLAKGLASFAFGAGPQETGGELRDLDEECTQAQEAYSFAFGQGTHTTNSYEVAFGKYNFTNTQTIFSIGNGSYGTRSNLFQINKDGSVYLTFNGSLSLEQSLQNLLIEHSDAISGMSNALADFDERISALEGN